MNSLNNINVLFFVLIVTQLIHCVPNEDEDDVVPEEVPEVPNDSDSANSPSLSQAAIDEYLKEHPEAKGLIESQGKVKMKRVFNQYGDIVAVPDIEDIKKKIEDKNKNEKHRPEPISGPPPIPPPPPFPIPYYNSYSTNPYYNPMFYQRQGMPQMVGTAYPANGIKPIDKTKKSETMDNKLDELLKLAQSYPIRADKLNRTKNPLSLLPPPPPMAQMPDMVAMNPMYPMRPMPFPYGPYPGNPYFQVNGQDMQVIPMPLPNGLGMDPMLLRQLENGRAQLDMAHAQVVPITESESDAEIMGTESETLENRPEMPEVVIPKPEPTKKKRKRIKHGKNGKPYFLMRARLKDLPKAGQTGQDMWWTKPVPEFCFDPIREITKCKDKSLEKRWSFNKEDEKCYLYEDECHSLKKNTFKSLKDCMITCWRPKK